MDPHAPRSRPQPPQPQRQRDNNQFDPATRRPYSWKTDELQKKPINPARQTQPMPKVRPLADHQNIQTRPLAQNQPYQALQHKNPNAVASGYRCPRCATQMLPTVQRKISSGGWITFAVLLVFFFPLFWIGLLIKEEVRICPVCNLQIG
ncbi:MAG: LITAF-like zinc ribbon domain-containing protein [Pyrinomonadaceae bacterium]|nr:LITAF-like zinc ribbon domain-containing protein [Pyrinomonadaceae bacterium]